MSLFTAFLFHLKIHRRIESKHLKQMMTVRTATMTTATLMMVMMTMVMMTAMKMTRTLGLPKKRTCPEVHPKVETTEVSWALQP